MTESLHGPGEYKSSSGVLERVLDQLPHLSTLQRDQLARRGDAATQPTLAATERSLPDMDAMTMSMLGVKAADIDPSSIQRAPTKEGKPNLSEDYQIATRPSGEPVFMKALPKPYGDERKLGTLLHLASAQGAVFGSRIADRIGYPMARTELVRHNDQAWLLSDYHAGRDHSPNIGLNYSGQITNPDMVAARPLFDTLLGYKHRGPSEGVVDEVSGEYFAIDTGIIMGVTDDHVSPDEVKEWLAAANGDKEFVFTPGMAGCMRELEAALGDDSLPTIFDDVIGPEEEAQRLLSSVRLRAQALVALYREQTDRP